MATTGGATGFVLHIDDDLITKLGEADSKIQDLAKHSEDTRDRVIAAFKEMGDKGVQHFIDKLTTAQQILKGLSASEIKLDVKGLDNLGATAAKGADDVNRMFDTLVKMGSTNATLASTIASLTANISSFKTEANATANDLDKLAEVEERLKQQSEALNKIRTTSINDKKSEVSYQRQMNDTRDMLSFEKQRKAVIEETNKSNANAHKANMDRLNAEKIALDADKIAQNDLAQQKINAANAAKIATMEQANAIKQATYEQKEAARQISLANKQNAADARVASEQIKTASMQQIAAEKEKQAQLKRTINEINRLAKAYKAMPTLMSSQGLSTVLNDSRNARSINQYLASIHNIKNALRDLDRTDINFKATQKSLYKELDRLNKELVKAGYNSDKLRQSHRNLMDISGQLQRRLALIFSVSQVSGYMNKLVGIRGEFELQQKSLQVLLQNKDEADKLWQQTVDLAVKSPFRVGELVSYTRQLAAYRIETGKLFDTTKRLADVSAGLGVDMSRLILAYGQVRAANYLRGTELRQFTEAGIPMLDELAKRFTELEGRMVSAGDVFERISKRMVSFKDVEAVFRSMTDAGGTFYMMQEKQSETLKGMISNLHDTIDLMLNDLGKSNEGFLKGSVDVANAIVQDWRKWAIAIKDVAAALALLRLARIISALIAIKKHGIQAVLAMGGLKAAVAGVVNQFVILANTLKAHPYMAIAGTLIAAAAAAKQFYDEANRINTELDKMDANGLFDATKSAANFKRLARVVTDTTKTYEQQKQAIEQLRREYKDILPDQMLTAKGIKELNSYYSRATQSIYEYIAAKTKESKVRFIESEYSKEIEESSRALANSIKKAIKATMGGELDVSVTDLMPIVQQLQQGIEEGAITYDNVNQKVAELIKLHTGLSADVRDLNVYMASTASGFARTFGGVETSAKKFFKVITDVNKMINEVKDSTVSFGGIATRELDVIRDRYLSKMGEIKESIEAIKINPEDPTAISKLDKLFKEIGLRTPEWNKIINDAFKLDQVTLDANKMLYRQMMLSLSNYQIPFALEPARENYVERVNEELQKIIGSEQQKEVKRLMIELSDSMNIPTTKMENFFMESSESISEYATRIKGIYDNMVQDIKIYDADLRQGTNLSSLTEEQYKRYKQQMPLIEKYLTYFSAFLDKDKSKGAGKDWFAELAKNIKDANKEFASLNKTFDAFTAKQMTIEKFKGVFEETLAALRSKKVNIDLGELDFTTEEGAIDALKLLKKRLPESAYKSRVEIEKALSDIKGEVAVTIKKSDDEQLKRDVQKIFDKYSLFLELKKINVPKDMAKQLFDIDATDLEEVKRKLEELKPQFKGKEMEKIYKDYVDRMNEMEAQAQVERAKNYVKYLLKTQSEAVRIKLEELRQIQEIENTFDADKAKKAKDALRKETQQKLQKQQWTDFKNSDMYSLMFDNLEYMGTTAIEVLYSKLEQLKGSLSDLPADSVKDIMTQINKLEKIKVERNPFKALRESLEEINNLQSVGKTEEYLQRQLAVAESEQRAAQNKLDTIDLILNAQDKELLKTEMGAEWTEKNNKYLSMTTAELEGSRALYSSIVSEKKKEVAEAAKGLSVYANQRDSLEKLQAQWGDIRNTFNDVSSSVMGALEAAGVDADSMAMSFAQMGSDMIDVVLQAIQMHFQLQLIQAQAAVVATTMNTILGVVGWIALALQGVSKLFSALFSIGDKKKQKEIEKIQDQVDALTKSYERLSTAVDEAFDLKVMQADAQAANRNLQQQINKYNEMIALENAKKKTDKDKIQDWRDEIASLQEEIAENNKKIFSTATDGIVDSVMEASRQFTDAWLEAFQETGSGLTGLESEFKDMMQRLVKQQASMLITQKYVDAWKTSLEQFINPNDLELTTDEARRWVSTVTSSLPQLNQALKNYFDAMQMAGVDLSGDKSGDQMSGLQRGIESLSEATGEILASYLNSIRFFVSEQNSILSNIANSLGATNTNNPMLSELKAHTELIRSIRDGLNSMMRGGHRLGGMGLKIFMD